MKNISNIRASAKSPFWLPLPRRRQSYRFFASLEFCNCPIILIFLVGFVSNLIGDIEKRLEPISVKTSLIIPCKAQHAKYLPDLLDLYAQQTMLVDEVIISVGPEKIVPEDIKDKLKSNAWPFDLKVLYSKELNSAADNRNIATDIASGDIFIYQDSDDIPHPQRIEVIKYFFENYIVDHLMHNYVITYSFANKSRTEKRSSSEFGTLDWIPNIESLHWYQAFVHYPDIAANNSISITRNVFERIRWQPEVHHGEDCLFNETVYQNFKNCVVIDDCLYNYFIRS